jgi:hypothetical protein
MRRLLPAVALVALILLLPTHPADAGKGWCRTDPAVLLDGQLADIWVASTLDAFTVATGPTQIVVTVPIGTTVSPVISDLGFGYGYDVQFVESADLARTEAGLDVTVAVWVPASDDTLPVQVDFVPRVVGVLAPASAEGTANMWVTLDATL